jgi:hypothetical protein
MKGDLDCVKHGSSCVDVCRAFSSYVWNESGDSFHCFYLVVLLLVCKMVRMSTVPTIPFANSLYRSLWSGPWPSYSPIEGGR